MQIQFFYLISSLFLLLPASPLSRQNYWGKIGGKYYSQSESGVHLGSTNHITECSCSKLRILKFWNIFFDHRSHEQLELSRKSLFLQTWQWMTKLK